MNDFKPDEPRPSLGELISTCAYIDAHTHQDDYRDTQAMIREVESERILTLTGAVSPDSIRKIARLNKRCPWIQTAAGIHPWKAGRYGPEDLADLSPDYAAALQVSEIGMDRVWAPPEADLNRQEALLEAQLELAVRYGKPVTLHTKGAEQEVLNLLKRHRPPSALIHWFDGSDSQLKQALDLGCFFTLSPALVTDRHFRELCRLIPRDRLLPETDNPGTWPWLFKTEGRPLHIKEVVTECAAFLVQPVEELSELFRANLKNFLCFDQI
ncbi:MAG: TatD family hydrolase [Spirochaetales bacterium]|nr:TatD family hydrolase [Spirochaetales bacterium]